MRLCLNFDEIPPPSPNEVELTVFGPGFGESIVLHIPTLGWAVIDSCEFKSNHDKFIPPLEYLIYQNVNRLAFIVLSHPHKDHFTGMENIIEYFLGKMDRICRYEGDGVRELAAYLTRKSIKGTPGARSFASLLDAFIRAKNKGAETRHLGAMTKIIPRRKAVLNDLSFEVEVLSLSPMAEDVDSYVNILREAISDQECHITDIPDTKHNLISSAIWIQVGEVIIILGSDVEKGNTNSSGWKGILGSIDKPNLCVKALKVSHHGSQNAYYNKVWAEHCNSGKIISIVTPYNRTSFPIPTEEDISRIKASSEFIGITSYFNYLRPLEVYGRTITKRLPQKWQVLNEPKECGMVTIRYDLKGNIIFKKALSPASWIRSISCHDS